jgi:mitochondrial fission protein ELM1
LNHPLTIWVITDGKPGHQNQSLGLAEALARRVPCQIHPVSLTENGGLVRRFFTAVKTSRSLPAPDLVIGAGHATHAALLWLARKHRAKSIVLMKPSLPISWFDHCIAPEHDFPNGTAARNVILSKGALNRIVSGTGEKSGKLILIGGPSKTHGWDSAGLLQILAEIDTSGPWDLTDSRRTPEGFLTQVREKFPRMTVISQTATPPGWVPEKLKQAKEVWVTEDSISMIYEALTSGARVGLLPLPRLTKSSRVLRGVDALVAAGFLTPLSAYRQAARSETPPQPFREADRCADLLWSVLKRTLTHH